MPALSSLMLAGRRRPCARKRTSAGMCEFSHLWLIRQVRAAKDRAAGHAGARRRRWVPRADPAPPPLKRRGPLPRERGTLTAKAPSRCTCSSQRVSDPRARILQTARGGVSGRLRRSPAFTRLSSAALQLRREDVAALSHCPCPADNVVPAHSRAGPQRSRPHRSEPRTCSPEEQDIRITSARFFRRYRL